MKSHKPLPVFVQNRLKEINCHKNNKFRHVTATKNPADLAARGLSTEERINNDLWWHVPSWLIHHPTKWPSWDFQQIDESILKQMAKQSTGSQIICETSALNEMDCKKVSPEELIAPCELSEKNYSSLSRLLRVTAGA